MGTLHVYPTSHAVHSCKARYIANISCVIVYIIAKCNYIIAMEHRVR